MNKFSEEVTKFLPPFWNGIFSKEKRVYSLGSKFFLLRVDSFPERASGTEKQ